MQGASRLAKDKVEARRSSARLAKQSPLRKTRPRTANAVPKKTCRVSVKDEVTKSSSKSSSRVEWGRMNVFVRGRPLSTSELQANAFDCLEIADQHTTFLHEFCASDDYLRMKRLKTRQYQFDHVFNVLDTQRCVYEATAAPLVESVLSGQNASCFCYGATGTGKTHTMLGTVDDPGIMVLAFKNLFEAIDDDLDTDVTLTYVEIYNEALRDLLNPKGPSLELRELPGKGVTMSGVREVKTSSAEEVVRLLHQGNKHRRTESTRCNRTSSRSHALLQIRVARRDGGKTTTGKLSLVDLAGSERTIANEKKSSSRSVEGANINKSLLSLSSCIRALVEGKKHIPFRNSKLTQMLKDSLGGQCQTAMIATVTPSSLSLGETANTLHWAERAKQIKLPGARTKHVMREQDRRISSHPIPSYAMPVIREKRCDKPSRESGAPVGSRAKKLQSLAAKQKDIAGKLAKAAEGRSSRKRAEAEAQEREAEAARGAEELSRAMDRIGELEHEVKRLRGENEAQRSDHKAEIAGLRREHDRQVTRLLRDKDEAVQGLLAAAAKGARRLSAEAGTQCAAQCKSTANQAMTPVFKAYMEEKMRDKENSSPVTRLELPMTPRPQHH